MKFLFDTDHISILQKERGVEYDTLKHRILAENPVDIVFSIISFHEQFLGCQTYLAKARSPADIVRGYRLLAKILDAFSSAPVLPFDQPALDIYDSLVSQKIRVSTMDLRIASIALNHQLTLVTRNDQDFRKIPGLAIEDWTRN